MSKSFRFWLGGAVPQTPRFLVGGGKAPPNTLLNSRPQHLIEAAKRGRLDQMLFFKFGAADDTGTADDRPAERTAERPAEKLRKQKDTICPEA